MENIKVGTELLDMEEDGSFDLQVSVAILIDELNQWFD